MRTLRTPVSRECKVAGCVWRFRYLRIWFLLVLMPITVRGVVRRLQVCISRSLRHNSLGAQLRSTGRDDKLQTSLDSEIDPS